MAALKSIFRRMTWETRGLKIHVEYLSHLRFAEDVHVLIHQMNYKELADKSKNQGLKINKSKTNVMMKNDTPIYVNNGEIHTRVHTRTHARACTHTHIVIYCV